ncbi:Tad domain-containing protein [Ramlibacter sp. PS4R-6]|uniref:Tad domain-containing protein n=1 Tax=Ramlibacter sp. PS4R-6 TaxID=3133438 RepID=UPI0030AD3B61
MATRPARRGSRRRQGGAMLVTAALVTLLLLGFMGAALDFGRLFVIRTELQTAMDGCALAAAQELDGQGDALVRARNAGKSAADANRVDFQSAVWRGLGLLDAASGITFRDATYNVTAAPAAARYSQCQHTHTGSPTWLLQALGAFGGNAALAVNTRNVNALAVATRGSAQSTCPLPIALRPKTAGAAAPNFGYAPGEWVTLLTKTDTGSPGYAGWANLDGTNSASNTTAEMNGYCGVTIGTNLGTPGVQSSIVDNWNWRFGIYKNNQHPYDANMQPDRSGYIYTASTWPSQSNAWGGNRPPAAPANAANFQTMRANRANCVVSTTVSNQSVANCAALTGIALNSFKDLIEGGTASATGHQRWGTNRRIVLVPVTRSYPGSVADYACMLMLQPLTPGLPNDVKLEFIGNAAAVGSPCSANGLPGGTAGPLVPVLVR